MMKRVDARAGTAHRSWMAVVALGAPVMIAAVALVDQAWLGWTRAAVRAHYAPFGLYPDPDVLTWLTLGVAVVVGCGNAAIERLARHGRQIASMTAGGCLLLLALGFAALASLATEYGGPVMATPWRALPWALPVAVVLAGCGLRRSTPTS